jgi:arylsulfatase A-like enzyme
MFSGQYPSETGVVGQVELPSNIPLLAEWFKTAGYETFGIPGPSRIGSDWGYDRGFDQYLEKWRDIPSSLTLSDLQKAIQDTTLVRPMPRHLLRMAKQGDDKHTGYLIDVLKQKIETDFNEPFFIFANYPFVHAPYNPPRPYKQAVAPGEGFSRPQYGFMDLFPWTEERIDIPGVRTDRIEAVMTGRGDPQFFADPDWLSDSELNLLRSWYTASVEYLDHQLNRLFDWLNRTGRAERTIVFVVADHGEYLGEHGLLKHMYFHFEEAMRVPVIISGPGVAEGRVREDYVSLIDVFDTICDLANIEPPAETTGYSMFNGRYRDAVFMENGVRSLPDFYADHLSTDRLNEFERGRKTVRTNQYLFAVDSAGEEHLYETHSSCPVDSPDEEVMSKLRKRVVNKLGEEFQIADGYDDDLDDVVKENLRELGYI